MPRTVSFSKIKIICVIFCVLLLLSFIAYIITFSVYIPNSLNILQGNTDSFSYGLPLTATITPENISVINVNNQEVKENITVSLSEPVTISSEDTGQVSMRIDLFGLPLKTMTLDVIESEEVIPCGMTIGVKVHTEGILVLGTGYVNGENGDLYKPADGVLKTGDLIRNANGTPLSGKSELINMIEESEGDVSLGITRGTQELNTKITPVVSGADKKKKIGVWVRDQTQGIGTITYYKPESGAFGALGHGIIDVDTRELLSVKSGEVYDSSISAVKRGKKGVPGELMGDIHKTSVIGEVKHNSHHGIFGTIYHMDTRGLAKGRMKIGLSSEIHEGPAEILCNVDGEKVSAYDVYIESVNHNSGDESKGLVLKITDLGLLSQTGGIVQGMSGSPIIQEDKLIGAVTHVFVQDPTKGYGIFIENMLKHENG
ncbi:MAG: SpoIVB peptidase [Clostridiales bacterium]|jgi:stage IV sporulation protein B|nr:SpoIVB peptidase [Clostridiales bacterium]